MTVMTDEKLDEVLGSNDLDAINELLNKYDDPDAEEKEVVEAEQAETKQADETDSTDHAEVETEDETVEASKAESESTSAPDGILSRDGKHVIPYSRLEVKQEEAQRYKAENETLKTQVEELTGKLGERDKLFDKLERSGIDPESVQDPDVLTEQQLADLSEYEDLGETVKILYRQNQAQLKKAQELEAELDAIKNPPAKSEVDQIIDSDPILSQWVTGDPEKWAAAQSVDSILMKDPNYAETSLKDRIPEVIKRTNAMFGETVQTEKTERPDHDALAQDRLKEKQQIPSSLTDSGVKPDHERSQLEVLSDLNGADLISAFEKMTPAQQAQMMDKI